jgi:hypothetical protein
MTFKLQHSFTLIVGGPKACGKSTFVIRMLECRGSFVTECMGILSGVSENNVPRHVKDVSFLKGIPDLIIQNMCLH